MQQHQANFNHGPASLPYATADNLREDRCSSPAGPPEPAQLPSRPGDAEARRSEVMRLRHKIRRTEERMYTAHRRGDWDAVVQASKELHALQRQLEKVRESDRTDLRSAQSRRAAIMAQQAEARRGADSEQLRASVAPQAQRVHRAPRARRAHTSTPSSPSSSSSSSDDDPDDPPNSRYVESLTRACTEAELLDCLELMRRDWGDVYPRRPDLFRYHCLKARQAAERIMPDLDRRVLRGDITRILRGEQCCALSRVERMGGCHA